MKKLKILGILIITISIISFIYYETTKKSDIQLLNERWSISLPENMKEIDSVKSESSWHEDGDFYYIYQVESLETKDFHKITDEDYKDFLEQIDITNDMFKTSNENKKIDNLPEKNGYYLKKVNGEECLILIYSNNYLYVYESLL